MPRIRTIKAIIAVVLPVGILSTGCSTLGGNGDLAVYRDSATDVVNRAPRSMSVQPDGRSGASIDETYLRTQADYHYALAETYSLDGDAARAVEEYKLTLIYDTKSPLVRVRLAAEYVKQGLVSEAIEQAKAALEIDSKYDDAHLLLGGLYSALRMYDDALKEYQAVVQNTPSNLEAPLFIGALLAEQKKFAEASAQFEQLAKNTNNPNAHIAYYYLGRVRFEESREKNWEKAESAFLQATALKPSYVDGTLALGELYQQTGRRSKAVQLYKVFQEKSGPSPQVAEELSKLFIEDKDYTSAYQQFAVIEASDPSDLNVKAKMAFILIEQQRYKEAIVKLEDVLALEPSSDKIRFYLGAVNEEIKDYKTALGHFLKVPAVSSYYGEAVVHAAYLYKLDNNYAQAIATIEAGIKNKDDHAPFYALYASLLDDQKQYKKAESMLEGALAKFPENPQLNFFMGNMQDRLGNADGAITSMKKVLAIDSEHVQALNFLAYVYAEKGVQLVEAEQMVRKALELQPGDAYIMDTLGWVLFKQGKVADAIRMLEAAYKIQPNESVIAEHLGDAYYHQQMPEKAKKLYIRAAEMESNVASTQADRVGKLRSKIAAVERQSAKGEESPRVPASTGNR